VSPTTVVIKHDDVLGMRGGRCELVDLCEQLRSSLREVVSIGCGWSALNWNFRKGLHTIRGAEITGKPIVNNHCTAISTSAYLIPKNTV
jgi:hypothetical protein